MRVLGRVGSYDFMYCCLYIKTLLPHFIIPTSLYPNIAYTLLVRYSGEFRSQASRVESVDETAFGEGCVCKSGVDFSATS